MARAAGNTILEQTGAFLVAGIRRPLWVIEQNYTQAVAERSFTVHAAMLAGLQRYDQ